MIEQQLHQKRRFSAELTRKTRELEDQLEQQRALIDGLKRNISSGPEGEASASDDLADRAGNRAHGTTRGQVNHVLEPQVGIGFPFDGPSAVPVSSPRVTQVLGDAFGDASPGSMTRGNDALDAFLAAAGESAEVITRRPELKAAFESIPLELSAAAIESCTPEERGQAL